MSEKRPYRRTRANGMGTAYKRGKTWMAAVVVGWQDGLPVRRTKGGFATKREALEYCPVLKNGNVQKRSDTIDALFKTWVPYYEPRICQKTMEGIKSAYQYLKGIRFMRISEITVDDLQEAIDACPRGRRTKENIKYLLTQLYKYAEARHQVEKNLAPFLYCGTDTEETRPPFSTEQIEAIWTLVGRFFGAEYILCMIYTGFRPNEMLSLTRESYDEKNDCLIGGFKTEAGTNRPIPICPKIAPILRPLITRANPYIFPNKEGGLMSDYVFRHTVFYPALAEIGIQPIPDEAHPAKWKPYSCRHTFANLMKNVQGSDTDKAALMGHADASMTKYYQSSDLSSIRSIMNSL